MSERNDRVFFEYSEMIENKNEWDPEYYWPIFILFPIQPTFEIQKSGELHPRAWL